MRMAALEYFAEIIGMFQYKGRAAGARQIPGFATVPLFDARQMAVKDSLPLCIRALVLADTDKPQKDIRHVYLGEAALLRQDLVMKRPDEPEEE